MAYSITYTHENWQPLGSSFYQTVHHCVDSQTALLVVLECSPPCTTPHVYEAAVYHRDGYEWNLGESVDIAAVLVREHRHEGLQERAYGV